MATKKAAGFVIFKRLYNNVQYLMMQTSYGNHHWTPPKGHVDPGESDLETAYRETIEESGLSKQDLKVYEDAKKVITYQVNNKPKIVVYWLAELINTDAQVRMSDEHQDFKWLSVEDACKYGNYEEMQETLKYFDQFIKDNLSN